MRNLEINDDCSGKPSTIQALCKNLQLLSKNIKGFTQRKAFGFDIFVSHLLIPDKLLPSRACFRLTDRAKINDISTQSIF